MDGSLCHIRCTGIQPDHTIHMAEPCQLALGIVAGRLLEFICTGFQRSRTFKIREEFLIANGLRRRAEAFTP